MKTVRTRRRTVELGCKGHFIDGPRCRWSRHTQIGLKYRVSSVGDYAPYEDDTKRRELGASPDSFFETMVFRTGPSFVDRSEGCGCREVIAWSELECKRYATAGEAQAGHEAMVKKYARKRS